MSIHTDLSLVFHSASDALLKKGTFSSIFLFYRGWCQNLLLKVWLEFTAVKSASTVSAVPFSKWNHNSLGSIKQNPSFDWICWMAYLVIWLGPKWLQPQSGTKRQQLFWSAHTDLMGNTADSADNTRTWSGIPGVQNHIRHVVGKLHLSCLTQKFKCANLSNGSKFILHLLQKHLWSS